MTQDIANSSNIQSITQKINKPRAIDIFPSFTLLSDRTYSQNIILNYAIQTKSKSNTIATAMNFLARSACQAAFRALEEKYHIIETDKHWNITINYNFQPSLFTYKVKNGIGRPRSADSNIQSQPHVSTDWQLLTPSTQES